MYADNPETPIPKRRGRPPGSKNKPLVEEAAEAIEEPEETPEEEATEEETLPDIEDAVSPEPHKPAPIVKKSRPHKKGRGRS